MKKTIITAVLSSMILVGAGMTTTAMAKEAKTKHVSCYHQAKAKGLKTKKEIRAFEKECKAKAKKAHKAKKAEESKK